MTDKSVSGCHHADMPIQLNTTFNTTFNAPNQVEDVEPQSVIHAPAGFGKFVGASMPPQKKPAEPPKEEKPPQANISASLPEKAKTPPDPERPRADSADSSRSDHTVTLSAAETQPHQKVFVEYFCFLIVAHWSLATT